VKEYFKCSDLPEFDNQQAANAVHYIKRNANGRQLFFMYVSFMKVHNPNFPSAEWKGKSEQGNFSDSMMELETSGRSCRPSVMRASSETPSSCSAATTVRGWTLGQTLATAPSVVPRERHLRMVGASPVSCGHPVASQRAQSYTA